jgi:predicted RND superfamily exporter protein
MLEYKALWDKFVGEKNSEASVTAKGAWHTSASWVRAESEVLIMKSSTTIVGVAVTLGIIGVFIYTFDVTFTAFVLLLVMITLAVLCFVMFVCLGWSVGPLEVISLVVFMSYSVCPALHISRRYFFSVEEGRKLSHAAICDGAADEVSVPTTPTAAQPGEDNRVERTKNAVLITGGTAMNQCLKTLGCSFFLLFATLRMFSKLGTVIFVVTLVSMALTFVVYPALLATFGPKNDAASNTLLIRKARQKIQSRNAPAPVQD